MRVNCTQDLHFDYSTLKNFKIVIEPFENFRLSH